MKRRMLCMFMVFVLCFTMLPAAALAAGNGHIHERSNAASECIVCRIAGMINALPDDVDITLDNAAGVTDDIHAIDRIKAELSDEQYEELLGLVETMPNAQGAGYPVPKAYVEAVDAIKKFGGNSLYIQKSFIGYSDEEIANAVVEFTITGDNGYCETLTMSDMAYMPDSLSADADFYSADADGWTFKYILPAGNYTITESSNAGAVSTTYTVDGVDSEGSASFAIEDGEDYSVSVFNWTSNISISLVDDKGNPIDMSGFSFIIGNQTFSGSNNQTISFSGFFDSDTLEIVDTNNKYLTKTVTLHVDENDRECTATGTGVTEGSNVFYVTMESISVSIAAVDEVNNALGGARIQITDAQNSVVEEWTSTTEAHEVSGLIMGNDYTVSVISPTGYYMELTDGVALNASFTFSVETDGSIDSDMSDGNNTITISFYKISNYVVPLKDATITYGDSLVGKIVDWDNVTNNGEKYSNPFFSTAFMLLAEDMNGNPVNLTGGSLPVGTYTVTGRPNVETVIATYDFGAPVTVTVVPLELTEDMFTVTAADKEYDGNTDADLTVAIRKENPQQGLNGVQIQSGGPAGLVYDDVTADAVGSFESAAVGENKSVNYVINTLSGADAANYVLPDGGIRGTTTASITGDPTPIRPVTPPIYIHRCTSVCEVCGGCTDYDCNLLVCEKKCLLPMEFADVAESAWYFDEVEYVYHRSMMEGVGGGKFAPELSTSRAMIWTILARLDGVNTSGEVWYEAGQKWAVENGISDGTMAEEPISREQFVTMLYRYAAFKEYDISKSAELGSFADAEDVSDWAATAMQWAVASGIVEGDGVGLNPKAAATRAQAAALLMRYIENIK